MQKKTKTTIATLLIVAVMATMSVNVFALTHEGIQDAAEVVHYEYEIEFEPFANDCGCGSWGSCCGTTRCRMCHPPQIGPQPAPPRCSCPTGNNFFCWTAPGGGGSFWCSVRFWTNRPCSC